MDEADYLAHYGILRRSGRYPWGSGNNQLKRSQSFLDYVHEMRNQGMSDVDIAQGVGLSTTQLRALNSISKSIQKQAQIGMAQRLRDKGNSNIAIGVRMGLNESSVRALLAPGAKDRADVLTKTAAMLRAQVKEKTIVDIGSGVENHVGVSKEKLATAVAILQEQGYMVHRFKSPQIGTTFDTEYKVLTPPGTTQRQAFEMRGKLQQINSWSDDGGRTYGGVHDPITIHPSRLAVRYKEDGGAQADGVILVRPGVADISLGKSRYAQVRVKVGSDHYAKGMAMYDEHLPHGVDLLFNTNKSSTGNKLDALKKIEDNPDLPFGSVVRQILAHEGTPQEHVTSAMNIVNEEGDWADWTKTLASQFLSKQSPSLVRGQLALTQERRNEEFAAINALTNPTVKKLLLGKFADGTDAAAVHLKAARLPRQGWHAILPLDSISPSHIYAPNYRPGERVVLIRYPHGGTFEIPELTVDNSSPEAKRTLGDAIDAVGIHHSVASRLSGADFDGDTVLVIPNNSGKVKSTSALTSLINFDPMTYKIPDGSSIPKITSKRKEQEMGNISNLITDMTIRGASHAEIARAVRHSMVVIDSEKKGLNFRQSAIDNGITQLKQEYQGSGKAGASTLISRAESRKYVLDRKARLQSQGGAIDRVTGERVFVPTNKTQKSKIGAIVPKQIRSTKLAETTDAHTLSSGTPIEKIYADHSNALKALANKARLAEAQTPSLVYAPSAAKQYAPQVASLNSSLVIALKNRPRERQAQILANNKIRAQRAANPGLDGDSLKKIKGQAITEARIRTGAGKDRVKITQSEWNAIQAGAISNSMLTKILANADLETVRNLATPPRAHLMTSVKTERAKEMLSSGYTRSQVADALGVSLTTLDVATKKG